MAAINTIQLRRGTEAEWTSADPVLSVGEPALSTDVNKLKMGDGSTVWSSLNYIGSGSTSEVNVYVKNNTGSSLTKGQAVYINGALGNNPTIALAVGSSEATSSKTLGLLKQDLAINAFGYVITEGILEGIDTDGASSAGDAIWLSPSTAGGVVYGLANKPSAPDHMVFIGYVLRKQLNNGKVYIKPQNGFELQELHNVAINGVTTGQFLYYDGSTSLWKPEPLLYSNTTNIGIGTSSPSKLLDIGGDARVRGVLNIVNTSDSSDRSISVTSNNMTFTGVHGIFDYSIGLRGSRGSACGMESNTTNGYLALAAGGSEKIRIATDGKVGIGTTSPLDKIHVSGSQTTIRLNNSIGYDTQLRLIDSVSDWSVGINQGNAVGSGYFNIKSNTASANRFTIDTNGNVGIGTVSPSTKLDVNGNVNIDGNLTFDSFTESVVAIGNSSTSQTLSLTSGTVQTCTLTANCTFTMPTATAGKSFSLFLNTGAGNFTATFTGVRWADSASPTITILANKVDLFSFISDGTYWYGSFSQNYG